jgi:hypothetical protein
VGTCSPTSVPSAAANTGPIARTKSTFATDVWFSAMMNVPDDTAVIAAKAMPARPMTRNAPTTWPRSETET